jgi:hypothetical protein
MDVIAFQPIRLTGAKGKDDWFELTVLFNGASTTPFKVMAGFSLLARDTGRNDFPDVTFRVEAEAQSYVRWCLDLVSGWNYKFITSPSTKQLQALVDAAFGDDMAIGYAARVAKRASARRVII